MNFIIQNTADEVAFTAYKEQQRGVRHSVAAVHRSCSITLNSYAAFAADLDGGALSPVADYHAAQMSAAMAGAEALLLAKIGELKGLIEQLEAASPGLFPGVSP